MLKMKSFEAGKVVESCGRKLKLWKVVEGCGKIFLRRIDNNEEI